MSEQEPKSVQLQLLGSFQIVYAGEEIGLGVRQQYLLAALALLGPKPRHFFSEILWPERSAERAMGNLRATVHSVVHRMPGVISANNGNLGLSPCVEVDLYEVSDALHAAVDTTAPITGRAWFISPSVAQLLPGWYDGWVMTEQDRLRTLYFTAAEHLARLSLEHGNFYSAQLLAENVQELDPWRESAVRLSIEAQLGLGNHASALRTFDEFCATMDRELGAPPSHQITQLMAHLRHL